MIITNITGGLGNQLFQYAAGKALAEHCKTELKLDLTGFKDYQLRNFDLDYFHLTYDTASIEETEPFLTRSFLKKIKDRTAPFSQRRFNREKFFHYDKNFFKYNPPLYIKGYWQSERYFTNVKEQLRNELILKKEVINQVETYARFLQNQNSVSIHIRRGDYQNPETLRIHGILSNSYYKTAILEIRKNIENAVFYVFTDSLDLIKKDSFFKDCTIVSSIISQTHFEDLYLMSQCKHNIIANSSFSWWGAWLNNNPDKIVIAPKNWFNKGPKDTYDLYPTSWIQL
jgi:Glycosyl transferase family 11